MALKKSQVHTFISLLLALSPVLIGAGGNRVHNHKPTPVDEVCAKESLDQCYIASFKYYKTPLESQRTQIGGQVHIDSLKERFFMLGLKVEKALGVTEIKKDGHVVVEKFDIYGVTSNRDDKLVPLISTEWLYKKRVLSLGEGYIGLIPYLVNYGADAYGIDLDYSAEKRKTNAMLYVYNDRLLQGDATAFSHRAPFKLPFDLVVSSYMLDDLTYEQGEKAIIESIKVLKDMGEARFSFAPKATMKVDSFEYARMLKNVRDWAQSEGIRVRIRQERVRVIYSYSEHTILAERLVIQRWD